MSGVTAVLFHKRLLAVLMTGLALTGCGDNDSAEGPGGVTAGEARALNEAAEMLDARAANAASALTDNAQNAVSE
ncbi:hypothetical protein OOT33_12315 [Sphingobium sp. DEHP117]|uniref:hypothetical protein n=1 Tax=Sphingobium sp. DEHP117 TaxID=2993436 RepID=UPI0027D68EE7|nr:hypothetical protein [Sphingobium sp. DEHP117]MDQ4421213.1 hypothetical protein [Sphingobium sp. DEHP117]